MNDFFSNLFKKSEEPVKPQPRAFYKREENERVEVMHRLDNKINDCDKRISQYQTQLAVIDEQLKSLKQKLSQYKNQQSQQALALRQEGARLVGEKEKLQARVNNYQQQKATLSVQRDNLYNVVDIEEMNELTKLSTEHIQKAVGKIDLYSAKTSASEARQASKNASQLNAYIVNPLDLDLEENATANLAAFDKLDFGEEEFIDEPEEIFLPSLTRTSNQPPLTNKPKVKATAVISQSLLDDEYL